MGFFDKLLAKRRPDREAAQTFQFVTGYSPVFRTFEGSIYESDMILASLDAQ